MSYLHEMLEEWPECNAGEGMREWREALVVCLRGLCVYVWRRGWRWGVATAAGQQLILSRETGSARSGRGGGAKGRDLRG